MMDEKGQLNVILAALVIGGIVVVGLYVVLPNIGGGSGPSIPGMTEDVVKVSLNVEVESPSWDWESTTVDIQDRTIRTKEFSTLRSAGPFISFGFSESYKHEVLVRVVKDDRVVDSQRINVELSEEWWELQTSRTLTFEWIEMGEAGTGDYTIEALRFDDQGDQVDSDSVTRSI